ncbi:MAG: hypothetical protein IJX47_07355 [Clostridia bacterium]|nr:hypothetical protein [Clostridia bacterium]
MSEIKSILTAVSEAEDDSLKVRLCECLNNYLQSNKPGSADRETLLAFIFDELRGLMQKIPSATDYRSKDTLMEYENQLMGLLMKACPDPRSLSPQRMETVNGIVNLVEKERFFENAVDKLFAQETVYPAFVEQLVNTHRRLADEYHKSQLYAGMIHYAGNGKLAVLSDECKAILGDYIASEAARYLGAVPTEQMLDNLELMADVAKHVPTDALIQQMYAMLKLGRGEIGYFAVDSLLSLGRDVPADVIDSLANNLTYANMTYDSLRRHGKEAAFPSELATEEYLAKSDLVHWLTYPTELGKEPNRIEYLGKVKSKGENYHVFRYQSDSDNLGDELKGKWLIGWSGDEGSTFSQFDEYALYEQKTPEKTLKYIKKKLIG